jgi:hypothetical protein
MSNYRMVGKNIRNLKTSMIIDSGIIISDGRRFRGEKRRSGQCHPGGWTICGAEKGGSGVSMPGPSNSCKYTQ